MKNNNNICVIFRNQGPIGEPGPEGPIGEYALFKDEQEFVFGDMNR